MDPLTHAFASYSLVRAFLPRATRFLQFAAILAGAIADLDLFSSRFGPVAYLKFHRTALHSLPSALALGLFLALLVFFRDRRNRAASGSFAGAFLLLPGAALLHTALDLCQSEGLRLLWPFSDRLFYGDLLAHLDLWILVILLAGVLLPRLASLVSDEIGAKSSSPRGRIGATVSLILVIVYIGARATLHSNAIAALEARTYQGELPRRIAALPASLPFRWTGVIETERALHSVDLNLASLVEFDPDSAVTSYKPDPSSILAAAENTPLARFFLSASRFPKAAIEQTRTGYRIELRSFPYNIDSSDFASRLVVIIDTDPSGKVLQQELARVSAVLRPIGP